MVVEHTESLGYAYALSGRSAEGIPLLEHALSAIETMGFGVVQPLFLVYLGEAHVLADQLELWERSSAITRFGSTKANCAFAKESPCFRRFSWSLSASHSKRALATAEA